MFAVSSDQENEILQRTAEIIAEAMMTAAGGVKELVVIPMATVTLMTGLSRMTVPHKMRVTKSGGKDGVTIAEIERYIAENTREIQSKGKRRASA